MPLVTIKTSNPDQRFDVEAMAREIGAEMGIDITRVNIMVERFHEKDFYKGSKDDCLIIHISALKRNGLAWMQTLMKSAAKAAAKQLNIPVNQIIVYAHPIEDGYFFSEGKIKG